MMVIVVSEAFPGGNVGEERSDCYACSWGRRGRALVDGGYPWAGCTWCKYYGVGGGVSW